MFHKTNNENILFLVVVKFSEKKIEKIFEKALDEYENAFKEWKIQSHKKNEVIKIGSIQDNDPARYMDIKKRSRAPKIGICSFKGELNQQTICQNMFDALPFSSEH